MRSIIDLWVERGVPVWLGGFSLAQQHQFLIGKGHPCVIVHVVIELALPIEVAARAVIKVKAHLVEYHTGDHQFVFLFLSEDALHNLEILQQEAVDRLDQIPLLVLSGVVEFVFTSQATKLLIGSADDGLGADGAGFFVHIKYILLAEGIKLFQ